MTAAQRVRLEKIKQDLNQLHQECEAKLEELVDSNNSEDVDIIDTTTDISYLASAMCVLKAL